MMSCTPRFLLRRARLGQSLYDFGAMTTNPSPRIRRASKDTDRAGRRWRLWLGVLPAILAILLIGVVVLKLLLTSPEQVRAQYIEQGDRCFTQGDYEGARVCYMRLLMQGDDNFFMLRYAQSIDGLGQHAEALAQAERVAPPDKPGGYVPAHLWIAERIVESHAPDAVELDRAERHAQRVLEADPNNADAAYLLRMAQKRSAQLPPTRP
jgi:tetratricopeptide (TPR) repeat protein